ncbi:uncharacterized protein LOC117646927 [Thrips palmi]|uniref:Uncharacterized protein LOC117646927 n=1 Tax=Thrips palmi TaxID=161013 RepID=A0A6P8Z2G5_THRPL|nr:uncharacterized protein LOC117646927 [Thrips palmi]
MHFWAFILIFTAAHAKIQVSTARAPPPRAAMQFHAFEQCKGVETPFLMRNSSITRSRHGAAAFSADFFNHKVLKTFSKLEITMTKCADAVSYNTCEYEGTHKFSVGLCQLITSPTMPWSSSVNCLQPPVRCPLATGAYALRNATVDMSAVFKLAGPGILDGKFDNIYKADVRVFNEKNEMHICFTATYSVKRIKN